jgi:hypothetical protein
VAWCYPPGGYLKKDAHVMIGIDDQVNWRIRGLWFHQSELGYGQWIAKQQYMTIKGKASKALLFKFRQHKDATDFGNWEQVYLFDADFAWPIFGNYELAELQANAVSEKPDFPYLINFSVGIRGDSSKGPLTTMKITEFKIFLDLGEACAAKLTTTWCEEEACIYSLEICIGSDQRENPIKGRYGNPAVEVDIYGIIMLSPDTDGHLDLRAIIDKRSDNVVHWMFTMETLTNMDQNSTDPLNFQQYPHDNYPGYDLIFGWTNGPKKWSITPEVYLLIGHTDTECGTSNVIHSSCAKGVLINYTVRNVPRGHWFARKVDTQICMAFSKVGQLGHETKCWDNTEDKFLPGWAPINHLSSLDHFATLEARELTILEECLYCPEN